LSWAQRQAVLPYFEDDTRQLERMTGAYCGDWLQPRERSGGLVGARPAGSRRAQRLALPLTVASGIGRFTPPPPGRAPHSASRRASGTTQPQAPLRCPGGETLLARGASPRSPGASRTAIWRASGTTMRAADLRASGT